MSALVVGLFPVVAAQPAEAQQDPPTFSCETPPAYLFQEANPNQVWAVDLFSGEYEIIADDFFDGGTNGWGYNVTDDLMWGKVNGESEVIRTGSDFEPETFGVADLPAGTMHAGDVSEDGVLYLSTQFGDTFYLVDVNPDSDGYLQMVDTLPRGGDYGHADYAFSPIDGFLYAHDQDTSTIVRYDPDSGDAEEVGVAEGMPAGAYGAAYADHTGSIYLQHNAQGEIYRIEAPHDDDVTAELFSDGPGGVTLNDGARCMFAPVPGMEMVAEKTSDVEDGDTVQPGDVINYTITVENTGDVDIEGVEVEDPLLPDLVCEPDTPATLEPGDTLDCTGSYEVTEEDADEGSVTNTATVIGDDVPDDTPTEEVPVDPLPQITSNKTSDVEDGDTVQPGDVINYTITVENVGEVDATGIEVTDPLIPDLACDPDTPATLAPGETLDCTGPYEVTEEDADEGSVTNTATVIGDDVPDDTPTEEVPVDGPDPAPNPELTVDKTSEGPDEVFPGDVIDYTITVTNTGDVAVTNVEVNDPLIEDLACDPDTPADLAPGDVLVCEGDYEVTEEDADEGSVVNTATVIGEDPDGDEVSDDDSDLNPIGPSACLPEHSSVEDLVRLSGETRVDTTIAVSQERWIDECDYDAVVLTRADVYADSLSGTPLAQELESPILITASNELYDHVADEITRLMPDGGTVYMLGGYAALDENVEASVEELGYDITRLGGPSRFETAGLIAEYLLDRGDRDHVLIADGTDHSDALVAGTAAGVNNGSVLLTPGEHQHQVVDEYLADHDTPPLAIGVSSEAYPDLDAIVGPTRDATAVQVAEEFFDDPTHVGIARSDDFPDALGGGAHIGGYQGPLVLTHTDEVPEATAEYLESIPLVGGYAYGGTHAIDEATFEQLEAHIHQSP